MTAKRHAIRIRLRDARELYLLVGECRAFGGDGVAWRRHLVTRLRQLFGCEMANFSDNLIVGEPNAPQGWIRPLSIIDEWECSEHREVFWSYVRRGRPEDNPMFDIFRCDFTLRVARRCDYLTDERWYGSPFYQDYVKSMDLDDYLCAVMRGPEGVTQAMVLHRSRDAPPFSRREAHILKVILLELQQLQPHELSGIDHSALTTLPRRMLQVLACLLGGHTVKQTAKLLGVSAHTVQEHVKRLYNRSGTNNRAALADCYRSVAPMLLNTALEECPDHQQQISQATRHPWPAASPAVDGDFDGV